MTVERFEVQRTIEADPAAIFRVLATRRATSPSTARGCCWTPTGEPATAVGDTFVVHMDREALNDYPLGKYDVTVDITTFEQDREIAWTIVGQIEPPIGHVYGYRLEPVDEGTLVTSYYDWSTIDPVWREAGHLPDPPRGRAAGDARHPRPHRGRRVSRPPPGRATVRGWRAARRASRRAWPASVVIPRSRYRRNRSRITSSGPSRFVSRPSARGTRAAASSRSAGEPQRLHGARRRRRSPGGRRRRCRSSSPACPWRRW